MPLPLLSAPEKGHGLSTDHYCFFVPNTLTYVLIFDRHTSDSMTIPSTLERDAIDTLQTLRTSIRHLRKGAEGQQDLFQLHTIDPDVLAITTDGQSVSLRDTAEFPLATQLANHEAMIAGFLHHLSKNGFERAWDL